MAGEIQLNSTTMATESSGSITAQLDTIRPNTTNGSLTLQGDSSDAGVTGLTIDSSGNATFAQTIAGGTIGSSVVFPSGVLIDFDLTLETSTVTKTATDETPAISGGTTITITVPDGCTAIITAAGGKTNASNSTTRYNSTCLIVYTTDGSTPTTSSPNFGGSESFAVSPSGSIVGSGFVSGSYANSSGSSVTLKWVWGVKGHSTPLIGQWATDSGRNTAISLQTLIFRT